MKPVLRRTAKASSFAVAVTKVGESRRQRSVAPTSSRPICGCFEGCGVGAVRFNLRGDAHPVVFIAASGSEVRERMSNAIVVGKPFDADQLGRAKKQTSAGGPQAAEGRSREAA